MRKCYEQPNKITLACKRLTQFFKEQCFSILETAELQEVMCDEDKVPDRETCQKLIEDFTKITDTNEALAQTFLQDHEWNLEKSVSAFYVALDEETHQKSKRPKSFSHNEILLRPPCPPKAIASSCLYDPSVVEKLFGEGKAVTTEPPPVMKFLTWNLEGLNLLNLKRRTRAVIKLIQEHEPDIVFFQEVVLETAQYFESKLPEYKCIRGGDANYFSMTLLRIFTIYYDNHSVINYPGTQMDRNLIVTEAHMGKLKLQLLNTHLESTREHSTERKNQLKLAFDKCKSFDDSYTVIFGGDLNLRDNEADIPNNFFDLWEFCGSPKEFKYTWDMSRNTNNTGNFGKFKPKCRFDRVYYRFSVPKRAKPKHFVLIGCEKVPQTQSFPSDHWGIAVLFEIDHSV